jgi:BASS family bile acid:Na+ symporter
MGDFLVSLLGRRFWLLGYAFLLLGFLLPGDWAELKPAVPVLLGGILFFSFLRLPLRELQAALAERRRWITAGWLTLLKLLVIPVLVWAALQALIPAWAAGVLLVVCMPAGLSSLALTDLQRGDRALALLMVLITSLVAPLTVPALLTVLTHAHADWRLVAERAVYISALLVIPFLAAQACRAAAPAVIARHHASWGMGAIACSMTLIGVSILAVRGAWAGATFGMLMTALALTVAASLVILAVVALAARRMDRAAVIAFGCGAIYMNNGLAVAFAVRFYPGDAAMVLPAIMIQVPMLALTALMGWKSEKR